MIEKELTNRLYSYAFYSLAAAMFVASIFSLSLYFLAFAIALLFAAAFFFSSGHLVNNLLLKRIGAIDFYEGFRLSKRLCAVTRKNGNSYLAISAALLWKDGEKKETSDVLESLVSNVSFPFEFCLGIRAVDKRKVLEGLETKRRMKEIEITRSDISKYDRISKLKRELSAIEGEIRGFRERRPLVVEARLRTFWLGQNEMEAARESEKNIEQLSGTFSSMLGFEYEILKGENLLEEVTFRGMSI
jgi:hypothetical protein